jgi:hypothetical protein
MRPPIVSVAIAACALCAASAQAVLYKWVDEKGVTQYTETPPPEGKAAKKLEIAPSPSVAPGNDDWRKRDQESKERHLKDDQQKAQDAQSAAVRRSRCLKAQREIDVLNHGIPVYHVNERGERVYLDDGERAMQLAGWSQQARENCD